ncbi:MAG: hypothetical protein JO002_16045, partial [Burkholderiaceae bacterium]|nr:hypothetical protein [Burkholderiaceae bacterium]
MKLVGSNQVNESRAVRGRADKLLSKTKIALSLTVLAALYSTGAHAQQAPAACDPYKNYACLDDYLGSGFFER